MSDPTWNGPDLTEPDTGPFWEAAQEHRLCFPWCDACGSYVSYPPRTICPSCGSADLPWREAEGPATVEAATTIRRHPDPWLGAHAPYVLGLVALAHGALLLAELRCEPGEDVVGRPAELAWAERSDAVVPVFEVR